MSALPIDPKKPGKVWCSACRQSLHASRAGAHLASKKHATRVAEHGGEAAAPTGGVRDAERTPTPKRTPTTERTPKRTPKRTPTTERTPEMEEDSADFDDESAPTPKKAPGAPRKAARHPPDDPNREGYYWCGICRASLTPTQAKEHLATKRHQDNSAKYLSVAMKSMDQ